MFKLYSGIKQGLPLSPMLFIFYVNDMFETFRRVHGKCVESIFKLIHLLIHADDVTLLATNRNDTISKLQTLCIYCKDNYIIPQTTKCKFCTINGDIDDNRPLPFANTVLNWVDHLEILGSHICSSGSLRDDLELHMQKRFVSCIKYFNFCHENKLAPVSVRLKTLRACVMSSILYNCETFGHLLPLKLVTIYNKLIRTGLQVRTNTPSLVLYTESGLLPVQALVEARQFKFFKRFQSSLQPDSERQLVFDGLCDDPPKYLKHYKTLIDTYDSHQEIYKYYNNDVKAKIRSHATNGKPRYEVYLKNNPNLEPSPFLQCMHPFAIDLIRFRVGSHCLPIETGRWCQKKKEDRICDVCGIPGDEHHYLYDCPTIDRDNLNLDPDVSKIWWQPEVFQLIGRLKSQDLL